LPILSRWQTLKTLSGAAMHSGSLQEIEFAQAVIPPLVKLTPKPGEPWPTTRNATRAADAADAMAEAANIRNTPSRYRCWVGDVENARHHGNLRGERSARHSALLCRTPARDMAMIVKPRRSQAHETGGFRTMKFL